MASFSSTRPSTGIVKGLGADRVRFYEMNKRYVHSKLILADDRWWCIGSANVNPRGFGLDSELNVQFREPTPDVLTGFRKRLWAHNLGVSEADGRCLERLGLHRYMGQGGGRQCPENEGHDGGRGYPEVRLQEVPRKATAR